ncbi:helix-turn-helix domain-containing protein [Marinobacterium lutimaris]|uniref:Transcriptional regulator, XRE family n=1 Tax=Marinobacterium lutimaris TaxID=568106 RepID=A0A1H5VMI6_9GAMM|nr:helix-turn-helix domain-containing protein [Marinobacterium lutimaris]SEF88051.1 transcriptional regulator, XRE family [Marinobacterium lutimaris]
MIKEIKSVKDLGVVVRTIRREQGLRQDDLGFMASCSHKFIIDVEKGKPTVQTGKLLTLLAELGVSITVDIPENLREAVEQALAGDE